MSHKQAFDGNMEKGDAMVNTSTAITGEPELRFKRKFPKYKAASADSGSTRKVKK
jgi:hypothetical protein